MRSKLIHDQAKMERSISQENAFLRGAISVAAKMHIPDDWKVTHWLAIPNLPKEEGGWE